MPSFDYDGYIDIDPEEFLSSCSSEDIDELIQILTEDGLIKEHENLNRPAGVSEQLFEDALRKLQGNWNMLTPEEEEIVLNISKRF